MPFLLEKFYELVLMIIEVRFKRKAKKKITFFLENNKENRVKMKENEVSIKIADEALTSMARMWQEDI